MIEINEAKKIVELRKDDRKILVTVYESGQVSCCTEERNESFCEKCQCDDETCKQWIENMKEKGYQATEIELGGLKDDSLHSFIASRAIMAEETLEGD